MRNNIFKIVASLIAVFIGILVGVIIIAAIGKNPGLLFSSLANGTFGSVTNFGNWLAKSVPIIFTGLAVGFAYRAGLFNIGAEGQFQMASLVSVYIGVTSGLPPLPTIIASLVCGTLAGAMWAFLPGILKAKYKINEVVVTIMLNWIAFYTFNSFITEHFHGDITVKSPTVPVENTLNVQFLENLTNGSSLNAGIFLAFIAIAVYWYIIDKTSLGYEIRAVGHSPSAAEYAGVNSQLRIVQTMMISGAFAGLGGAIYGLSNPASLSVLAVFNGFGFDGIAVALLGQLSGIGILFAGLLLGALRQAAVSLQLYSIPKEIADIVIGIIILFSALSPLIIKKLNALFGGKDGK